MFDLNEQYEHIADWSHRHEEDIRQHHRYDFDEDVGRGLRFDMLSWKGEAAKRVVSTEGFVLLPFKLVFDTKGDRTDAKVLHGR